MNYDLVRGLHIIAVIGWMAGMLLLPRLYVYHMQVERGSAAEQLFIDAERRLLRIIINPAMIAAWTFGLMLLWIRTDGLRAPGVILEPWLLTKLAFVVLLSGWHGVLAGARRKFAEGRNTRSQRYWRMTNELPFRGGDHHGAGGDDRVPVLIHGLT
jgi:putative membrane protein